MATNREKKSFGYQFRQSSEELKKIDRLSTLLVDACRELCPTKQVEPGGKVRLIHQLAGKVKCSRADAEIALGVWLQSK